MKRTLAHSTPRPASRLDARTDQPLPRLLSDVRFYLDAVEGHHDLVDLWFSPGPGGRRQGHRIKKADLVAAMGEVL